MRNYISKPLNESTSTEIHEIEQRLSCKFERREPKTETDSVDFPRNKFILILIVPKIHQNIRAFINVDIRKRVSMLLHCP